MVGVYLCKLTVEGRAVDVLGELERGLPKDKFERAKWNHASSIGPPRGKLHWYRDLSSSVF